MGICSGFICLIRFDFTNMSNKIYIMHCEMSTRTIRNNGRYRVKEEPNEKGKENKNNANAYKRMAGVTATSRFNTYFSRQKKTQQKSSSSNIIVLLSSLYPLLFTSVPFSLWHFMLRFLDVWVWFVCFVWHLRFYVLVIFGQMNICHVFFGDMCSRMVSNSITIDHLRDFWRTTGIWIISFGRLSWAWISREFSRTLIGFGQQLFEIGVDFDWLNFGWSPWR